MSRHVCRLAPKLRLAQPYCRLMLAVRVFIRVIGNKNGPEGRRVTRF